MTDETKAATMLDGLPRPSASFLAAEMARAGLHDLMPYWSPDIDGDVNPLDDPEQQQLVRRFLGRLWREAMEIDRA